MTINQIIDTERFELGGRIGHGCWGAVHYAVDLYTGQKGAIKFSDPKETAQEQMEHRRTDGEKSIRKEGLEVACDNVVSRQFHIDRQGRGFIFMPGEFKGTYADYIDEHFVDGKFLGKRLYIDNRLNLESVLSHLSQIGNGLSKIQRKLKRAYCDLKPDNVLIDRDLDVLISDLGTSTLAMYGSFSPRDNMGFQYTRAPEAFREESHPNERSDVWGFGSFFYRMFTGRYPCEDNLDIVNDIYEMDKMIKEKIKNVPRRWRKFLYKCLNPFPEKRFYNASNMKESLDSEIEKMHNNTHIVKHIKKWMLPIGVPALLFGTMVYAGLTKEVDKGMPLAIPTVVRQNKLDAEELVFDRETIELPDVSYVMLANPPKLTAKIQKATNHAYAAYLLEKYDFAFKHLGGLRADYVTKEQAKVFGEYAPMRFRQSLGDRAERLDYVAVNIEFALTKSKTLDGKIDLEDVCAIARVGFDKVNEARRAAKSFEFKDYIVAKNSKGEFIIPKNEQKFIRYWLAYVR